MLNRRPVNQIIYVDTHRCVGCHSCEIACALAHSEARDIFDALERNDLVARTHVVAVGAQAVPMQCRQCEDAPCTKVCPTGAARQAEDQGTVTIDPQTCIGCKMCSMVCPFGVITVANSTDPNPHTNGGVATKCDLCIEWRAGRDSEQTACEEACPTQAIRLVDLHAYREALVKARAAEVAAAHQRMQFSFM